MDAATLTGPAFEPHLTLIRAGEVLTFAVLREPCRLSLGSSTACNLRISARGVRPKHLEVAWDGLRLAVVWAAAPDAVRREGVAVAVPFIVAASTTLEVGEALLCLELGEAPPDDAPTRVMPALPSTTLASVPEPGRLAAACNRAREAVARRKRAGGTRPGRPLRRRAAILVATVFTLVGLALLAALASRGAPARSVPVRHPYPHLR